MKSWSKSLADPVVFNRVCSNFLFFVLGPAVVGNIDKGSGSGGPLTMAVAFYFYLFWLWSLFIKTINPRDESDNL